MIMEIRDLYASVGEREILHGISLKVAQGEFHVVMGPNGSGKTTLAKAIMGHPGVKITGGEILVDGKSINDLSPDKRAKLGLFLQFQNPVEINGVGFVNFIKAAMESVSGGTINTKEMMNDIKGYTSKLKIDNGIVGRSLNDGFSGGEKKKGEILQMALLKPKIAILDEPDSGLDIDAIKVVAENINDVSKKENIGLVMITHYNRILSYMKPQFVHILVDGRLVYGGGAEAVDEIEKDGYDKYINKSV